MENSLKGLMLAAGIIITCIIISLGFYIAREASDTASSGTGQINELQAEFSDTSKTMYENTEVSGSEVINVIRKFSDEMIGVKVQTKKNTSYYIYQFNDTDGSLKNASSLDYKSAQNVTSSNYINPTGRFLGTVVRDANGTITGLSFVQQ
ncbi:MAG: hypothetical protein MSA09_09990 [Lachnospiraceae bacterium]|nr:hypothetical protein [Lachnospiraceae bacterium]MDD7176901.1 hypothetical protein [bacterium]MDY5517705.1 hypothetical protein [Lachnospiraceae bacterium]